jgi:CRP-like cAMP-binding protein
MAFIDAEPRSATVSAPGGALVLDFTREALKTLKRSAPRVAAAIQRNVLGDVARRLRDAGEKLTEGARVTAGAAAPTEAKRSGRGLTAQQLRSIGALQSYSDEDLELLAYVATMRSFAAGSVLLHEGTEGDGCFLIVTGAVSVMRASRAIPLALLGPGAIVGQLALLDRTPRSATVTATQETIALEVRADAFVNLVAAHTPIALRFQEQVALAGVRQLRAATRKVAENAARESMAGPMSGRVIDDWDDTTDRGPAIELAVDPASLRQGR